MCSQLADEIRPCYAKVKFFMEILEFFTSILFVWINFLFKKRSLSVFLFSLMTRDYYVILCKEIHMCSKQIHPCFNYITCTNILLKKLGKVDSDVCSFCNFSREDLEHLLFVCPASQVFWSDFRLFWYDVMKKDITLSLKNVIVGVSGNIHVLLNYCILW